MAWLFKTVYLARAEHLTNEEQKQEKQKSLPLSKFQP
jgi:hypothetical protein